MARFKWTAQAIEAVKLVAEKDMSISDIAQTVGADVDTVKKWTERVDFKQAVETFLEAVRQKLEKEGVRQKVNRLNSYNDRWRAMLNLIAARAADLADIPGGDTGMIVRDYKGNVPVYKFDAALMKELRELEKQTAMEMGDWIEKKELSGRDGGAIPITIQSAINKAYGESNESTIEAESAGQVDDDGA